MKSNRGFTLVEMLVVIAIIGALAALTLGVTKYANTKKIRSRAQSDIQALSAVIDNYKSRLGFYPPGNGANAAAFGAIPGFAGHLPQEAPPLFYELAGTKPITTGYQTLGGEATVAKADIQTFFGRAGFANSNEETSENFLKAGSSLQRRRISESPDIEVFVTPSSGTNDFPAPAASADKRPINPIRYNTLTPIHNPGSYDLWVDVKIGDNVETIGNWKN